MLIGVLLALGSDEERAGDTVLLQTPPAAEPSPEATATPEPSPTPDPEPTPAPLSPTEPAAPPGAAGLTVPVLDGRWDEVAYREAIAVLEGFGYTVTARGAADGAARRPRSFGPRASRTTRGR